jgi:hypothetical protein
MPNATAPFLVAGHSGERWQELRTQGILFISMRHRASSADGRENGWRCANPAPTEKQVGARFCANLFP